MIEDAIREHIAEEYPKEACGIILNRRGKLKYYPCQNVAENPYDSFEFDAVEYVRVS
jgi:proteasome lid subunit RPN8/RPN11